MTPHLLLLLSDVTGVYLVQVIDMVNGFLPVAPQWRWICRNDVPPPPQQQQQLQHPESIHPLAFSSTSALCADSRGHLIGSLE